MNPRHQTLTVKKVEFNDSGPAAKITETTGQVTVRKGPFGLTIPVGLSLGRHLFEQYNGTTLFDADILRLKEAEFSRQSASELLSYAVKHDTQYGTLAFCKAIEKFNAMGKEGRKKAILRMQKELSLHSSSTLESRENVHAVTVISNFFHEASKSLPVMPDGELDTSICSNAVARLTAIMDSGVFCDGITGRGATLMQAGCRALWELGAGSYEFWERRLHDAPVRDFVITQMLEMPPTENPEEHGWGLLQKNLGAYAADIASNPSPKKEEFFTASLSNPDHEVARAAFFGAARLEQPSQGVLSLMAGQVKAAVDEYAARLMSEPEKAAETEEFITNAIACLVTVRNSGRPGLQPVIEETARFASHIVLTGTFTNDIPGCAVGKCAQVIALLTRLGAFPCEASADASPAVSENAAAVSGKSCEILSKIIEYGGDRQFAASHGLISIGGWATREQLMAVGPEMASIIAHPPSGAKASAEGANGHNERKRQCQAKAVAVLGHMYAAGLGSKEIATAFEKEFSEAHETQQSEVLRSLQGILGEHVQGIFERDEDTAAAAAIADLVGAVAKYYPPGVNGKCVSESHERTVELLRSVAESGRGFNASPLQRLAKVSSVKALYSLGFGEYEFWERRANDWVTADAAVTKILDEGFKGRAGRVRKKLLKANLASIHPLVWENDSEAKTAFLCWMLRHKEPETIVAAFHAAAYLQEIPEGFLSSARQLLPGGKHDKGNAGVRNAASVFLSIAAAKGQLRQPDTVFSAAHTVIDIYSAGNRHLEWAVQRIGFELVPAVFPLGGDNTVRITGCENPQVQANILTPPGFSLERQRDALTVIGKLGILGVQVPGVTFVTVTPEQAAEDGGACGGGPLSEGIRKAADGVAGEIKLLANPAVLPADIEKR